MIKSNHFKTEQELLGWLNANVRPGDVVNIQRIQHGDWVIFYID